MPVGAPVSRVQPAASLTSPTSQPICVKRSCNQRETESLKRYLEAIAHRPHQPPQRRLRLPSRGTQTRHGQPLAVLVDAREHAVMPAFGRRRGPDERRRRRSGPPPCVPPRGPTACTRRASYGPCRHSARLRQGGRHVLPALPRRSSTDRGPSSRFIPRARGQRRRVCGVGGGKKLQSVSAL